MDLSLFTFLLVVSLAFANGANDVSKAIATLVGSGVADYRAAILWGTFWTTVGAGLSGLVATAMVKTFSQGLLAPGVPSSSILATAVLAGAGLIVAFPGWWQLPRYDVDAAPVGVLRRRATRSEFGPPDSITSDGDGTVPGNDGQRTVTVPSPSGNDGQRQAMTGSAIHAVPGNDGQRTVTVPSPSGRDETRRDEQETRRDEQHAAGVRARAYEPAPWGEEERQPDPAPIPTRPIEPPTDARVLAALARWQRVYAARVPTGMVDDGSVLSVAADFTAEVFARGVERHCDEDAQFWRRTPIKFLRLRCEWERDKPPPTPQGERTPYNPHAIIADPEFRSAKY